MVKKEIQYNEEGAAPCKHCKRKGQIVYPRIVEISGEELFNALKENKIFVRHFNAPRINEYLRITIGTEREMEELISFLDSYISGKRG